MKKLLAKFFESLAKELRSEKKETVCHAVQTEKIITENLGTPTEIFSIVNIKNNENIGTKKNNKDFAPCFFDPRDIMEVMEFPFVALSKNRTSPIMYESSDGRSKVKISCHTGHYLASIYDWDIIILVSSKLQDIINSSLDIPPRTLVIPRHELLKSLYKHDGKKEEKDLKASLARLKLTGIETTIRNEDGRYDAGFGFLDSWGYTERKDIKEIRITLSQWLYDGICRQGSMLKVRPEYFKLTSGLKKFLYRTARKYVGIQNESWVFSVETLHKKSGSERELKKFKYDLKKAVEDNDIPGYLLEWTSDCNQTSIRFVNTRKKLKKMLSEHETPKFSKKSTVF